MTSADRPEPARHRPGAGLTLLVYLALVLFGLAQGVVGAFYYGAGPAPAAAVAFDLAIFATCVLGGWGTRRSLGALAPAAGWLVATFVLALGTPSGSVIIAAGMAGEWFLFGGALGAAAGVVAGLLVRSRSGIGG